MIRFILTVAVLVLLGWLALGQVFVGPAEPPVRATLAALMADPAAWEGRAVTVEGRVGDRMSFLGLGGITLADETGHTILVLGQVSAPETGRPVEITGQFITAYAVGQASLPVILATGEQ